MSKPTDCQGFDPAHANDPVMVDAHELAHALSCDSGAEIPYREIAEFLRQDVAAGAPLPLTQWAVDVLVGATSPDEDDADEIARIEALYPVTTARFNKEFE